MAKTAEERADDIRIMKLFRCRCVMNLSHKAFEVNEIVPRSRTKKAITMPKNRVAICRSCHDRYHEGGVTEEKMDEMYRKAVDVLLGFGVSLDEW